MRCPPVINAYNPVCTGEVLGAVGAIGNATAVAWPAADQAIFLPFELRGSEVIKVLYNYNATVLSGNIDIGIYTADGTRIVSSGSTAISGTNTQQIHNIADTLLGPGQYYIAIAHDGTSSSIYFTPSLGRQHNMQVAGVRTMTSAFPLPATATLSVYSSTLTLPLFGAATRTFV